MELFRTGHFLLFVAGKRDAHLQKHFSAAIPLERATEGHVFPRQEIQETLVATRHLHGKTGSRHTWIGGTVGLDDTRNESDSIN